MKIIEEIVSFCEQYIALSKENKAILNQVLIKANEEKLNKLFIKLKIRLKEFITKLETNPISQAQKFTFIRLYLNYLVDQKRKYHWNDIKPIDTTSMENIEELSSDLEKYGIENLNKIAIVKLNGGLGTSMGCLGPKSMIPISSNKNFLDITLAQNKSLNHKFGIEIPLILMNSLSTQLETNEWLKKQGSNSIFTYEQEVYPRIDKETGSPFSSDNPTLEWNPPGHGSIYQALYDSGILDHLLSKGKEIIFISNVDNLGAIINPSILGYMISEGKDFVIELARKTKMDIKGGTIVRKEDNLCLLERAQVPDDYINEFEDIKKFTIFNTNSIWIKLRALKKALENQHINLPLIVNPKKSKGKDIIQLETAMGAAIEHFDNVGLMIVGRDRFLPVKRTNDLLLLRSNLFSLDQYNIPRLIKNRKTLPVVSLGDHFKTVEAFNNRFKSIPNLEKCTSLKVEGDVIFEENVTLIGDIDIESHDPLIIKDDVLKDTKIRN